jgi:hypothetical protein
VDDFWSPHNLSIIAGLSVPTGSELAGEIPALHNYHLGAGALQFKGSARYDGHLSDSLLLFGSATVTIDGGPNTIGFRYGNGYDFQLGAAYAPLDVLRVVAAIDPVVRDKDKLSTITLPDSGGTWWFATVGVLFSPVKNVWIEPSVSIPVYWRVNGVQPISREVWSIGLRYRF